MAADYSLDRKHSGPTDGLESTSPAAVQQRSNPLASKVTSVLSASYADTDIRDALALLDKRNTENNAETRRQLRLDVQKEVIESNGDIIKEFSHVAEQLRRIGLTIASLNQGCEEMKRHISAAHQETAPVLEEASELMKQKAQVESKQELLKAFNTHFIMSDDDIATLTSSAEPVNDKFFYNLARAKKIQNDCEILLGTENQRLGLEIMEQVSKNMNGAFQKLYRWIQREFKSLNLENPQISSSIRRALRVLAERPSLFQNCLDFFAEAREHILSDSFYTALTGSSVNGEPDSSVKPIELAAHDPLRYVGDMLAWTHSATVSEREALEVLFISDGDEIAKGIQAGRDSEPWNKYTEEEEDSSFDGLKALNGLVDRDVTGVARVLRQRVGQIIQSHEETITAYKIANLLNFYRVTFSKLLGKDSVLLESLVTLEESALKQFRILMRDHVASLQSEVQIAPSDLHPPDFLQEGLKQLTAIMKTYEASFTSPDSREADFRPILTEAFTPFMSAAERIAKPLPAPSGATFYINCLLLARNILAPFDFTTSQIAEIDSKIQEHSATLVAYQYNFLITSSALSALISAIEPLSPTSKSDLESLRTLLPFHAPNLTQASQILDDFLPSALMDATENLKMLQSSVLVTEITEKAAERFCDDFERVEEMMSRADELWEEDLQGEGEPLRVLFPRTSGEIRVLLS
ncbi:hypothetical protein LZ554_006423 [Drepanopeziza brunnea f. sp. 'monogermtubi']|nr:hypothetical protein LZ554_006423 [Drepanopeziza brunnea f. sp. 'monogermtubi']